MAPNPQIKRISTPSGEMTLDAPYIIDRLEIRNDGDPGDIYLTSWCGDDADGYPQYPAARGRRLRNWSNVGHMQTVYFNGTYYLTDEYAKLHGQQLGLCGGCNPDGDCYPNPLGPTYFRYEVGYLVDGVPFETHSLWRIPLVTVLPATTGKGYLSVFTVLNNEAPIHAEVFLNGVSIGYGDGHVVGIPLDPGQYTISFMELNSWLRPYDVSVVIEAGKLETITGSYTPVIYPQAKLVSTTEPIPGPILLNGIPVGVGYAQMAVDPGSYVLTYGEVEGYTPPGDQPINIGAGANVYLTATYTPVVGPDATLIIETVPVAGEIYLERISPDPFSAKFVGIGNVTLKVAPGQYKITYGAVDGYIKPQSTTLTLQADEEISVIGIYNQIVEPPPPPPEEKEGFPWWLIAIPVAATAAAVVIKKRRR